MIVTGNESKSREKVYKAVFQGPDGAAAAVVATAAMPNTTKSVPVYDSQGTIIGYMALYANVTLT